MPTVTEREITGWAHCTQPRCPGNTQQQVAAIRTETARTYREMGGDSPGVEWSGSTLRFVDEEDRFCPYCPPTKGGRRRVRELSETPRIRYDPMSGHDPLGLLGVPEFDPRVQVERLAEPVSDPEREQMQAQIAQLTAAVEALTAKKDEDDEVG